MRIRRVIETADADAAFSPASIDGEQLKKLVNKKREKLIQLEAELDSNEKEKQKYEDVREKLESLPLKLRSAAMIPLTKVAFMPGELIHTNEILVLLGDGYFVETTAAQAGKIAETRISLISSKVEEVKKATKLARDLVEETSGFLDETSEGQFREIVEALPDDGGDDTCSDELADAGKRKSRISSSSAEQQRQQLIEKSAAIANSMKGKRDQHCDLSLSVDASRPLDTESEVVKNDLSNLVPSQEEKKALMDWLDELERQEQLLDEYDRALDDPQNEDSETSAEDVKQVGIQTNMQKEAQKKLSRSVSFADNVDVKEFSKDGNVSSGIVDETETKSILKKPNPANQANNTETLCEGVSEAQSKAAPPKVLTDVFKETVHELHCEFFNYPKRSDVSADAQEEKPRRESLFKKRKNLNA